MDCERFNTTWTLLLLFDTLVTRIFYKNSLVGCSASPIFKIVWCFVFHVCVLLKEVQFYIFLCHILYFSSYLNLHICYYIYNIIMPIILRTSQLTLSVLFLTWTQMLNNNHFYISNIPKRFSFTVLSYTINHLKDSLFLKKYISLTHSNDQIYSHLYNSNIGFVEVKSFNLSEYFIILVNV